MENINFIKKFIRKLVDLLQADKPKTVAIACFDLGEFCRYHPFGRKYKNKKLLIKILFIFISVLEKMKGKDYIMNKARGDNQIVKEQALVALQKIMIHNWQSLGAN